MADKTGHGLLSTGSRRSRPTIINASDVAGNMWNTSEIAVKFDLNHYFRPEYKEPGNIHLYKLIL